VAFQKFAKEPGSLRSVTPRGTLVGADSNQPFQPMQDRGRLSGILFRAITW